MRYCNLRTGAVIETACTVTGDYWELIKEKATTVQEPSEGMEISMDGGAAPELETVLVAPEILTNPKTPQVEKQPSKHKNNCSKDAKSSA